jgi:chromosome partitioning protein
VRNRLSVLARATSAILAAQRLGLARLPGDRRVRGAHRCREFFPRGLSAPGLDKATLGTRPNVSHVTARQEVRALLDSLKLPLDERGRRRAAARAEWIAALDKPLDFHDIVGEA